MALNYTHISAQPSVRMEQRCALGADKGILGHLAGCVVGLCQGSSVCSAWFTALIGAGECLDRDKFVGAHAVRPILPLVLSRGHLSACTITSQTRIPNSSTILFACEIYHISILDVFIDLQTMSGISGMPYFIRVFGKNLRSVSQSQVHSMPH